MLTASPTRRQVEVLRIVHRKVTFFFFFPVFRNIRFGDSSDMAKLMNMQLCLDVTSTLYDISFQFLLLLASGAAD